MRRDVSPWTWDALLKEWRTFCEKPPKGFEKYFKQSGGKQRKEASETDKNKNTPSSDEHPPSKSSPGPPRSDPAKNDWNFGMFNPSPARGKGRGSSGRPIGGDGGDKEKWILFGALGTVALVGTLAYFEMGYKEIGWKEFVTK